MGLLPPLSRNVQLDAGILSVLSFRVLKTLQIFIVNNHVITYLLALCAVQVHFIGRRIWSLERFRYYQHGYIFLTNLTTFST